jgi:hypothetical protein
MKAKAITPILNVSDYRFQTAGRESHISCSH